MKILHYTQEYVPATQTFVYDLIEQTRATGYDIRICTRKKSVPEKPLAQDVTITGNLNFIKPSLLRYLFAVPGLYSPALGTSIWKAVLEDFRPDLIHCHFAWSMIDVLPVLHKLGQSCPLLVSLHGTDVTVYSRLVKTLGPLITRTTSQLHFTVPSAFLKTAALANLPITKDSITVLPNMVNREFMLGRETGFKHGDELRIINIGRFVPVKGHRYLLEAFATLVNSYYENSRLTLVGTGSELQSINKLVRQHKLQSRVEIIPGMAHDNIPALLADCHIYVQPSIHDVKTRQSESFGLAVLEAIAVGLPVIVTDSGGLPETVQAGHPDSAIIVRQRDPDDIVRGLLHILENSPHQDPAYRHKVLQACHPDIHTRALCRIYQSLVNPK